ncbi:hypothetical protein DEO72_LG10g1686 [Vigna unguiculata]|uniref:Uncharacterized protein n=1 Tax=Vigna unguiculata TaxID=3917 RepID=A0A4D6N9P6_VIGUN|nr:hypothetical protein DEO72_LG10g1686 [Vigna unguiculata]
MCSSFTEPILNIYYILPFSGLAGSSTYKKGQRPYPDCDTISKGVLYPLYWRSKLNFNLCWELPKLLFPLVVNPIKDLLGARGYGDRTSIRPESAPACDVVVEEENETKEWMGGTRGSYYLCVSY